jgi:hypothetical protein
VIDLTGFAIGGKAVYNEAGEKKAGVRDDFVGKANIKTQQLHLS